MLTMTENGSFPKNKAEVDKLGQTAPFMKAVGKITKPMDSADSSTLTETSTRVNGQTILLTDSEYIST